MPIRSFRRLILYLPIAIRRRRLSLGPLSLLSFTIPWPQFLKPNHTIDDQNEVQNRIKRLMIEGAYRSAYDESCKKWNLERLNGLSTEFKELILQSAFHNLRELESCSVEYSDCRECVDCVERGLALSKFCIDQIEDPNEKKRFYKYYALFLHEWSCRRGRRVELANAYRVKKYLIKASQALGSDAKSDLILLDVTGRWNYRYIQIPTWRLWISRKTPRDASVEEALYCFSQLNDLYPNQLYSLSLARLLIKARMSDKAQMFLKKCKKDYTDDQNFQLQVAELENQARTVKQVLGFEF